MFERFTDRARRVVVHAQEEATELNHNRIGTEHLLLGLMREPEGVAARALRELKIGQDAVRERVIEIVGRGTEAPAGNIPFSPRSKKVLELSLREALQLNHNYIGTEHILLGLIREGQGVAAQVLAELGGKLSRVRDKVIELAPAGSSEGLELSAQLRRAGPGGPLETIMRRLAAIDERLGTIERHLGLGGEAGQAAARAGEGAPSGGGEPGTGDEPGPGQGPRSGQGPGSGEGRGSGEEPGAGGQPGAAG